jgi:peptidyl-prolyl cis-trans isomerase B (cyclophilin B)
MRLSKGLLAAALPILCLAVSACGAGSESSSTPTTADPNPAAASTPTTKGMHMVTLTTNHGDITIELDADKAPISAENFLQYVDDGHFDGTVFHRVIPGFMIQGGGFDASMGQKPTRDEIKNEAENGLQNDRGTLAMARTNVVDSATAQFFINLVDNDFLNHTAPTAQGFGYAVFGRVTAGMDVVDKIAEVPTGNAGGHQNVPSEPVVIEKASRAE